MMQHDSLFFVGIFIFIFILWIVLGGPSRPLSFSGPLLAPPEELGGGTYLALPRTNTGGGSTSGTQGSGSTGGASIPKTSTGLSSKDQKAVEAAKEAAAFGIPSTYRGDVSLGRVSGAGSSNPQSEYIQISVSSRADQSINLSGWTIASEVTGKGGTIPSGTEIPRSGVINPVQSIVLNPGDRAIITSGRSPIGASFRENVCIGYFGEFQKFTPSLPNSCPTPETELEKYYGPDLIRDPGCIDYVDRLGRCSLALSPPATLSGACQRFLTTYLNYNGCLAAHEKDANFKRTTWRIYLGRDVSVWRTSREVIKLTDATGKTVDTYSY